MRQLSFEAVVIFLVEIDAIEQDGTQVCLFVFGSFSLCGGIHRDGLKLAEYPDCYLSSERSRSEISLFVGMASFIVNLKASDPFTEQYYNG